MEVIELVSILVTQQQIQSEKSDSQVHLINNLRSQIQHQCWYAHARTATATARRELAQAMLYDSWEKLLDQLQKRKKT